MRRVHNGDMATVSPTVSLPRTFPKMGAVMAGFATAAVGGLLLQLRPDLEIELFARGAARLASLFTGVAVLRVEEGWLLGFGDRPVVVTAACSGADYFLIVAA